MVTSYSTSGFDETAEESNNYPYHHALPTQQPLTGPYHTEPYPEHEEFYHDDAQVIDPALVAAPRHQDSVAPGVIYGSYEEDISWSGPAPSYWLEAGSQTASLGRLDNNADAYSNARAHPNPFYSGDGGYYNGGASQAPEAQPELPNPTSAYSYQPQPLSNHRPYFSGLPPDVGGFGAAVGAVAAGAVAGAAGVMSPHIEPQPTQRSVERHEHTTTTLPLTPARSASSFECRSCGKTHKDAKSKTRHEREVHEKPAPGEVEDGWYQCKCGKTFNHFRKANYKRHRERCRLTSRNLPAYCCQCGRRDEDDAVHEAHYLRCREGRGRVGRPIGSGAANVGANAAYAVDTSAAFGAVRQSRSSSGGARASQIRIQTPARGPHLEIPTPIPQTPQTPLSQASGATEGFQSPSGWSFFDRSPSPYPGSYVASNYESPEFGDQ